jgi:Zn-dependent protease with chaperone function
MAGQKTGAGGSPAWLSTHPSDQKRIADLQAFMAVAVPLYEASRAKSP